jgi:4-hydroxy-3-polyprenylbenzoate decarboxylase
MNVEQELSIGRPALEALAHRVHSVRDLGASIASGSFSTEAMVIAPCSMRTLAAVANGLSDTLVSRAADVVLKERRRLVLLVRETPLNLVHLRNMVAVTEMGGVVFPPVPAFYHRPTTIDELVDHTVGRVLDLVGIAQALSPPWRGLKAEAEASADRPGRDA